MVCVLVSRQCFLSPLCNSSLWRHTFRITFIQYSLSMLPSSIFRSERLSSKNVKSWAIIDFDCHELWLIKLVAWSCAISNKRSSDRRNSSIVSLMFCFNHVNHLLLDIFTTNSLYRPTVDINEEPQSISTGNAVDTLALAGDFSTTSQAAKLQEIYHFVHVHF